MPDIDVSIALDTDYYAVFTTSPGGPGVLEAGARLRRRDPRRGERGLGPGRVPGPPGPPAGGVGPAHRRGRGTGSHPDVAAGRGPGEHGDFPRRRVDGHRHRGAGRPGAAVHRLLRQRRAEGEVAGSVGPRREAGRVRAHRAGPRLGLGGAGDHRGAGWRLLGLNGDKKWIGNGSVGDVTVVWAGDEQGHVRGFLVDRKTTPGYATGPRLCTRPHCGPSTRRTSP